MASPSSYTKHPSPPRSTTAAATPPSVSPAGGGFFSKPVLLGMFLLALPLFPSQAPDFVGETVLTKLWELIHLLFVGIAVAYGLFSRRNVGESNVESRMSCVDESSLLPLFSTREEEYGEINQVQAWNSRYSQGRSKVVVVARPAYGLDGHVVHQSLGLPVRSLRSALEEEKEKAEEESLADEMMAMGDDETRFTTRSSVSSSSSRTSFESNDQKNRYSPSRESLNSNVEEKSLQGSSRCSSPSLPPSPSPEIVTDETHRRVLHSRHYSDGSLLEEGVRRGFVDELEGPGSKSLKLSDESSWKGKSKSRRSYPPDLTLSPPVDGADRSTTRRRYLQQKSDSHLFEKGLESDHNKMSVKKVRSHDSLEFQPRNDKALRRAMRSPRGASDTLVVKDNKRNSEDDDDSEDYDLPGENKEVKSKSPRCEPQSWRGSGKVSSIGNQSNASNEHYEVDKKADEFIAKFREQIRLQKLHSGEQRRGGGTGLIRNRHFR
ncbi:hypothetical protein IGI04_014206 [Brassica rapa subsp. trilocularis]|uniref:DUF4408 domain-containing protein n=1 Tax=Brassica rapa subsp. trilocularis TaxID=1813537 RepID=A0ABQ7MQ34_BRACM|nr:hypothetical protein IGI04_014206 [Brassica rapa subsp. trilocularis]